MEGPPEDTDEDAMSIGTSYSDGLTSITHFMTQMGLSEQHSATAFLRESQDAQHDVLHRVRRQRVRHALQKHMLQMPKNRILDVVRAIARILFEECLDRTLMERWTRDYLMADTNLYTRLSPERFRCLFYTILFRPVALTIRGTRITLFQTWDDTEQLLCIRKEDFDNPQHWQLIEFLWQFPQIFFRQCHVPLGTQFLELTEFRYNYWLDLELPRLKLLEKLVFCLTVNVAAMDLCRYNVSDGIVSENQMRSQIYLCCNLMTQGLHQAKTQFIMFREQEEMLHISPVFAAADTTTVTPAADELQIAAHIVSVENRNSPEHRAQLLHSLMQELDRTVQRLQSHEYMAAIVEALLHIRRQHAAVFQTTPDTEVLDTQDYRLDPFQ